MVDVSFRVVNWGRRKRPATNKREPFSWISQVEGESTVGRDHIIHCSEEILWVTQREYIWSIFGRAYFPSPRTKGQLGAIEWHSTAGSEVCTEGKTS